jgi:hypothetical protein
MTKTITRPCKATANYLGGLINQPWAQDGRHCWRLVFEIERDLFGRILPTIVDVVPPRSERALIFATHAERRHWVTSLPRDGAIVLMRREAAQPNNYSHAGVFLELEEGGVVIHTDEPHGVVLDTLPELKLRGWVPEFFVPCTA